MNTTAKRPDPIVNGTGDEAFDQDSQNLFQAISLMAALSAAKYAHTEAQKKAPVWKKVKSLRPDAKPTKKRGTKRGR